jgi:hypothetical protein
MAQLLYPQGKSPQYPLDRRLGGPQGQSGQGGEEKNPYAYWESNPDSPACSPDTILTELPWHRYLNYNNYSEN